MSLGVDDIINESQYQFDNSKKKSSYSSKKSWWIIGLIIGLAMNFIAFLIFHIYHVKRHTTNDYLKTY